MEDKTRIVKTELANGTIVQVQVTSLGDNEYVAYELPSFKEFTDAVEGIAESVLATA